MDETQRFGAQSKEGSGGPVERVFRDPAAAVSQEPVVAFGLVTAESYNQVIDEGDGAMLGSLADNAEPRWSSDRRPGQRRGWATVSRPDPPVRPVDRVDDGSATIARSRR